MKNTRVIVVLLIAEPRSPLMRLDAEGGHQGGVIFPGAKLMQKALLDNTKIEIEKRNEAETVIYRVIQYDRAAIYAGSN